MIWSGHPTAALLFDLDGTLLDTAADFEWALNAMAAAAGRPPPPTDMLRRRVSDGAAALTKLVFPELPTDSAALEQRRQQLLQLYAEVLGRFTRPYAGTENLLSLLRHQGIPWGIVTNKPERFAKPLLASTGLDAPGTLICPEQVRHSKPDPEGLLLACAELRCLPAHSAYIGDHPRDILCGRNAGMRTAAASWGYVDDPEHIGDWQADCILGNVAELGTHISAATAAGRRP